MATGRIGVTPTLGTRWSKAPAGGTTSLSGLDDNSVALVYSVGYEQVYRNGVLLSRGNDYTATSGNSITLTDATIAGDIIEVFANELVPLTDAISKGQFTAKGALLSATAASTPGVLTVGSNDQVLTADSSTATGLKWATPAAGAYTSLASGTLSSTAVTLSSISQSYVDLYLVVNNPYLVATGTALAFRCNGVTSGYYLTTLRSVSTTALNQGPVAYLCPTATDINLPTATNTVSSTLYIRNYTATTQKPVQTAYGDTDNSTSFYGVGYINTTSAITSIQIRTVNGTSTFNGGTYTLYGVK